MQGIYDLGRELAMQEQRRPLDAAMTQGQTIAPRVAMPARPMARPGPLMSTVPINPARSARIAGRQAEKFERRRDRRQAAVPTIPGPVGSGPFIPETPGPDVLRS